LFAGAAKKARALPAEGRQSLRETTGYPVVESGTTGFLFFERFAMPRTKAGTVPKLQHHEATGQARVTIAGRDYYCGRWGSKESIAKYDLPPRTAPDFKLGFRLRSDQPCAVAEA